MSHAKAVQLLLDGGATLLGKTVCDEFLYSVSGANAHYGTPVNPHAPGRLPGGSSSGAASATARGLCDFALGSDTAGSVRVPASFCGLYGMRPTHGRVSLTGAMDMAPSFDTAGWFSSRPDVLAMTGKCLLDRAAIPAQIENVLVLDDALAEADEEAVQAIRSVLNRLVGRWPRPVHTKIAPRGLDVWRETLRIVQAYEAWQTFGPFIREHRPDIGPGVAERLEMASAVTDKQARLSRDEAESAREQIRLIARPGTILVAPPVASIAPRIDESSSALESLRMRTMRLSCIATLGGLPQMVVPADVTSGPPVGFSLIGWHVGDEALLDLGVRLGKIISSTSTCTG